jgi:hypothetical protein
MPKDGVDNIEIDADQGTDSYKQIVDSMLEIVKDKQTWEICMKTPLIDVRINSVKTAILIDDIKTFCLDKSTLKAEFNEFEICQKLEEKIMNLIPVNEFFNAEK